MQSAKKEYGRRSGAPTSEFHLALYAETRRLMGKNVIEGWVDTFYLALLVEYPNKFGLRKVHSEE